MQQFHLSQYVTEKRAASKHALSKHKTEAEEQYPVVSGLLKSVWALSPDFRLDLGIGSKHATPELLSGIALFLQARGKEVQPVVHPEKRSLPRRIIEHVAPRRLEGLPSQTAAALEQVFALLPQDGTRFTQETYALCKSVNEAARKGMDEHVILDVLLQRFMAKHTIELRYNFYARKRAEQAKREQDMK